LRGTWAIGRARALAVEALRLAVEQHNVVTLSLALPACILPLVAAGKAERAAELFALGSAMPLWHASQPMARYLSRLLAALSATLSPEALAAAMERGRGLEMWETGRALLAELEVLGWGSETLMESEQLLP
jgi:hypothetical protein